MFSFQAWRHPPRVGDPAEVAAAFSARYELLCKKLITTEQPDLRFEVIDVRPGAFEPKLVASFIGFLGRLLLADDEFGRHFVQHSRIIFVGSERTVATSEAEPGSQRSIKRDAEFYIRTLQNYEVAHYVSCGPGDINGDHASNLIDSALIGLMRHYGKRPQVLNPDHAWKTLGVIRSDFLRLIGAARELPGFKYVGKPDMEAAHRPDPDFEWLLREIGLLYQLGKGDRPTGEPIETLERLDEQRQLTFDVRIRDSDRTFEQSSYRLHVGQLGTLADWSLEFHEEAAGRRKDRTARLTHADKIAMRSFKLARYDLLRDFGRVLGQASLRRLKPDRLNGGNRFAPGEPAAASSAAYPILLVDDEFHDILLAKQERRCQRNGTQTEIPAVEARDPSGHLITGLKVAMAAISDPAPTVHVVSSEAIDVHTAAMQADRSSSLVIGTDAEGRTIDGRFLNADDARRLKALDLDAKPVELHIELSAYKAILIDPESRRDACGPVRVQRLSNHLHRHAGDGLSDPPLIAFSRKESSGYVQQCLNMGAAAFALKSRPFRLLFDLSRVIGEKRAPRLRDDHASQFRIMTALKPHVALKLRREEGPSFIHGGLSIGPRGHIEDPRESAWIRSLPKADLHYHLGTAIDLDTIAVLAMNTAGHFLPSDDCPPNEGANPLLNRIATMLRVMRRLEHRYLREDQPAFSRVQFMAAAAHAVDKDRSLKNHEFGLGDALIVHLLRPNDRCDPAHATALLVAMMSAREDFTLGNEITRYFEHLAKCSNEPLEDQPKRPANFTPDRALRFEMESAYWHFARTACDWNGSHSRRMYDKITNAPQKTFWGLLRDQVVERVKHANTRLLAAHDNVKLTDIDAAIVRAEAWLRENAVDLKPAGRDAVEPEKGSFPLAAYVRVPDGEAAQGLQLYLRGADFLGSSHLQYPENLWIAALAITRDNASENIIYSEVRCETTGFTRAGMGAHDATDLLRHGFNLASLYIAGQAQSGSRRHKLPLVRTNILLAAKRHKGEPEARAVVALLESYLERHSARADDGWSRRNYERRFGRSIPSWWRPCDVVGFDLSGDETKDKPWLRTVIEPLAARSSPVTIHAGESANAASIWRAVYELNAVRIGHGLRLSEDTALLAYCVREGICMEMCPNSNQYTNRFSNGRHRHTTPTAARSPGRYDYPLRYYMQHGMEVSLGTDNRYLHHQGSDTLTSEYMTAARLVGGLTRWEVLQIVKAGFKNAFIDKAEVRAMIEAVEEEIYRIVATNAG